jgi:hypothetical protein
MYILLILENRLFSGSAPMLKGMDDLHTKSVTSVSQHLGKGMPEPDISELVGDYRAH